jgi:lysophospholipase L1-like esterase
MSSASSIVATLVLLVCTATALPAVAQNAMSAPVAINPLYTVAPASLSTAQIASLQQQLADWPQLSRYRADNAQLAPPAPGHARLIFFGDSITDAWGRAKGTTFFPGKPYLNRGISGQTTAQMVLRFRQDVIGLHPVVVVILAGTNDIAGNTGLATLPMIEDNFRSMVELAQAHHIRVILASVLPTSDYPWHTGLRPVGKVRALNGWLRSYAASRGETYLDYYAALANAQGGMDKRLSSDGVHPTPAGYAIMAPLAQQAIDRALVSKKEGQVHLPYSN